MIDRPLVEFVCAETLTWEPLTLPFGSQPVRGKRLVGDVTANGAAVIELPEGWRSDAPASAPFELIVLEGAVDAGGVHLDRHGYLSATAGDDVELSTPRGPVLAFVDVNGDVTEAQRRPFSEEGWTPGGLGQMPGLTRCIVRGTVDTARGFFLRVPANWSEQRTEWHDCAEAAFVLDGELWHTRANGGAGGTMRRHCYFWRPRHVFHSPMGTDAGTLFWVYVDGRLVNHFVEAGELPPGESVP
jgi:hypothetical protein